MKTIFRIIIAAFIFHGIDMAPIPVHAGELLPPPPAPAIEDPDPRSARLCDEASDPDEAPDKLHINCRLEYGIFAPPEAPPEAPRELPDHEEFTSGSPQKTARIVAWNIERGMKFEKQLSLLLKHPDFREADVILISEADRGCSRTNYRNIARDMAKALDMNYAFGVEYTELPRRSDRPVNDNKTMCEHGNAVLSRHPILGLEEIRHEEAINNYIPPGPERENGEPRLGGCMAVAADIDFGGGTVMRVYSAHLEAGGIERSYYHNSETRELADHAAGAPGPVVIGGDMNNIVYINDLRSGGHTDAVSAILFDAGFSDTHADLPVGKRATSGMKYGGLVIIDLVFIRGARATASGLCPAKSCGKLSDHLPVWTVIEWD